MDMIEFTKNIPNCKLPNVFKNLYCIIGPSGCGKSTIAESLVGLGLSSVESYTTRPKRYPEEKGHTFVTDKEFDDAGEMIAYTEFNGYRYGVTRELLGNSQIYVIDVPGIVTLRRTYSDRKVIAIGITASEQVCAERMHLRGDSEDKIEGRLAHDRVSFAGLKANCNFVVNGDDEKQVVLEKICGIIALCESTDADVIPTNNEIYVCSVIQTTLEPCGVLDVGYSDTEEEYFVGIYGDWKHDHFVAKNLIAGLFGDAITLVRQESIPSGSDTYVSTYFYKLI